MTAIHTTRNGDETERYADLDRANGSGPEGPRALVARGRERGEGGEVRKDGELDIVAWRRAPLRGGTVTKRRGE